jgi:hypothetical protein
VHLLTRVPHADNRCLPPLLLLLLLLLRVLAGDAAAVFHANGETLLAIAAKCLNLVCHLRKRVLFLSFPYVFPEPVLVK